MSIASNTAEVLNDLIQINNDRIEGYKAGCDLNMPGGSRFMEKATAEAVRSGKLHEAYIDATVERILRLVAQSQGIEKPQIDWDAHHALALKVAEQGAVLLKNEDQILPLCESDMVLIGYMAANLRYQGSGSSHISAHRARQACRTIRAAFTRWVRCAGMVFPVLLPCVPGDSGPAVLRAGSAAPPAWSVWLMPIPS